MKQFDTVPIKKPAINVFNLSHDVKGSYNFDKIYPFVCHPTYPGDTFNAKIEVFLRTMPLFAPVLHNVDLYCYFFHVPNRLLWNAQRKADWKTFITGGEKGDFGDHGYAASPSNDFVLPHFTYSKIAGWTSAEKIEYATHKSLLDHMGFPTIPESDVSNMKSLYTQPISSLPFRAYQLVWNEYFRNQNVQNEIEFSFDGGAESSANLKKLFTFRKKCWEKDYFTSCLPFQQRGEAVRLPIDLIPTTEDPNGLLVLSQSASLGTAETAYNLKTPANSVNVTVGTLTQSSEARAVTIRGYADVSNLQFAGAGIGTISDFRYCLRLQQWLENNARCGSRYIEQILAHFGVVSSDARLQRPELLGGGKIPLIFSDVPQTSSTDQESVQGNLAGKGMLYGKTGGFRKYFEEHGILLGVLCIIPRTSYQQGIPRYWSAMDKTDFYFPEFAHLSEQAVLNKEVYYNPAETPGLVVDGDDLSPDGVFGYQGRFVELRYIPSSVHGELRGSLQYWHLGRYFTELPRLNADFVEAQTRANIFSIENISEGTDDPFVAQIHVDMKATRPMPKFAVPTI